MQHIFITNPAAGQGKAESVFTAKIIQIAKRLDIDYCIHRTMGVGDGERFIKKILSNRAEGSDEIFRIYACGGDGTLNEVVNGVMGQANAEIALIPTGTGNDFVRNFKDGKAFLDVEKQIQGRTILVDIIEYKSDVNIEYVEDDCGLRYCINMINMGLDCSIVSHAGEFKRYPLISGKFAYFSGIVKSLVKKDSVNLKIEFDDGMIYEDNALLVAVGNGKYYGGGFQGAPRAIPDDGIIDVGIVKNISRKEILSLLGKYRKGTHLDIADAQYKIIYKKCKKLTLKNLSLSKFCVDGEIKKGGDLEISILPKVMQFVVPF